MKFALPSFTPMIRPSAKKFRALLPIALTLSLAAGCVGGATTRRGGPLAAYDGPVMETKDASAALFEGRFAFEKDGARFSWSGSAITIRFRGTSVSAILEDSGKNRFLVLVDDKPLREKIVAPDGRATVPLVKGLARGEHTVTLYKLTEPLVGETKLLGFVLDEYGEALPPPPAKRRGILLVGDSISTGYGNEASDPALGFDPATENHFVTFGARAARELDASLTTVAWSGRGVYSNRGSTTETKTMKDLWRSVLPESSRDRAVEADDEKPDVVVVNLGTNDFAPDVADSAPFRAHFSELLTEIRAMHPSAEVVVCVGPLLTDHYPPGKRALSTVRAELSAEVEERRLAGDKHIALLEFAPPRAEEGLGADYHPSEKTHRRMAAELIGFLKPRLP